MHVIEESKHQFSQAFVSFLHVRYDQEIFDSKVQAIIGYTKINDGN